MKTAERVDIRRAAERARTDLPWLESHHSFNFGPHHEPGNTGHGLLIVLNDDIILPSTGFTTHQHHDMEIVTWVLDGKLAHKDSTGNRGVIYPGLIQRMSAGFGIWHSEMNPSAAAPVRLIQMWVRPDTAGVRPGYEQLDVNDQLDRGGLVCVASGKAGDAAIMIHQKDAALWAGRLKPGEKVPIPSAKHVHVFIAKGAAELAGSGMLAQGDAARLTEAGSLELRAEAENGAEVLIWETA
ncbi:MAG: pirin family protein [Elusimicrobiota bacterium]